MHHPATKKTAFLPWTKKQSKRRFRPECFVNKQSDFAGTGNSKARDAGAATLLLLL